jgi:hypothetical protein
VSVGTIAAALFLAMFITTLLLIRAIRRRYGRVDGTWADEYMSRFVFPIVDKARDHGVTQEELDEMWSEAMKQADAYRPPGGIFRDMVEHRIASGSGRDAK